MRPPEDAPSRYEPDGRDEPGRDDPGREEPGREVEELGRDELGREDDLDGELRRSDDRPCMLLPPRLLGREPELLAGDISVPDFFCSSALFSCFVQQIACCWCYLCDFSMTYLAGINQIDKKIRCNTNKKGPPEGDPFLNNCPATSYSPTPSQVQYHRR